MPSNPDDILSEHTYNNYNCIPFNPDDISDNFWEIIRKANNDRDALKIILIEKDRNDIYKFAGEFIEASIQLNDEPFLQYLGELSEDGTDDVCHWIVSQGKDLYQNIWNAPELISNYKDSGDLETLFGVAESLYEDKFEEEMPELYDRFGHPVFYSINLS